MAIVINNDFEFGEIVYLKTDRDQLPRIVFSFKVLQNETLYELASGTINSLHYNFEITREMNVLVNK